MNRSQPESLHLIFILVGSITDNINVTSLRSGGFLCYSKKETLAMLRQVSVWLCSFVIRKKGGPYPTHWGLGASVGGFQAGGRSERLSPVFFSGWMTMISLLQSVYHGSPYSCVPFDGQESHCSCAILCISCYLLVESIRKSF